jgi:hypothetical protein
LHIIPTLTLDTTSITGDQLLNGYILNPTRDGSCTGSDDANCVVTSNFTGGAIFDLVWSARFTTKDKKTITYSGVEVVAKMPAGDWLWPAIWCISSVLCTPSSLDTLPSVPLTPTFPDRMLPQDSVYGVWAKSGEIDIVELRGNSPAMDVIQPASPYIGVSRLI